VKVKELRRKIAGKKAQNVGKHFEFLFERACAGRSICCVEIPAGCITKGFNPQTKRPNLVRVKSPFDYIVHHNQTIAFVDTKTVDGKTFSYSMQTDHQIDALHKLSFCTHAGLVIWFRELDIVQFFPVSQVLKLEAGQSLGPEKNPGIHLGHSYNFDVRKIFL